MKNPPPWLLSLLAAGTLLGATAAYGCIESYDFIRQTDNPDQRFVRSSGE